MNFQRSAGIMLFQPTVFFLELLVSVGITFTVGPVGLSHCGSRTIKNTVQNLSKSPDENAQNRPMGVVR